MRVVSGADVKDDIMETGENMGIIPLLFSPHLIHIFAILTYDYNYSISRSSIPYVQLSSASFPPAVAIR